MPYIGRSTEAFGVRSRFTYLASANDTSVSGTDVNGLSLSFTDGAYVDVFLNGVRLKHGTDYVTTTANTIGSLAALAANDEIEVVVFDVFTLADMVSKSNGGTFEGAVTFAGDATIGDDLTFNSDSAVLSFGADSEITLTHSADTGLLLKHAASGDDKFPTLTLQTGDTDIAQSDVLGRILFQAPDEGTGTDAITSSARIQALSEGDFSSSNNATSIEFRTATSGVVGTAAQGSKLTLQSDANLILKDMDTADGSSPTITLQTGDTDIAQDDVLGTINFQAPDEATGTDAILVAAGIRAVSEGNFSSSNNEAKLEFMTGATAAASTKMALSSGGDLSILTDGASVFFGADSEIELRHVADDGLILKHVGTGDGKEPSFTFQAGDNDIAQDDVLGQINFQAPDEGAGTDAVLSAATIKAFSEGDFSSSNNATTLELSTGRSAAAGSDGGRIRLTSAGVLELKNQNTADDSLAAITLQTGDTDIAQNDILGKISFQAPDEGAGTDAILVSAAIQAISEGDFSASSNATSLQFMTGSSEAAAAKWAITSGGSFQNQGTNTIDMNAGELILDADADTSITADTDDRIDFRIGGTDTVHIDSSGIGVNINDPLYPIHVTEASGGDTAAIFIDGPTDGFSALYMGDSDDIDEGYVLFDHSNNRLELGTNATSAITIHEDNQVVIARQAENPGNNVCLLGISYALAQNYGGVDMYTYSYYSDIRFNLTNNDTLGGRTHKDVQFNRQGGVVGGITVGTGSTAFNTSSDYRLKEDEKTITDAIDVVKKLKPYNFKWIKAGTRMDGFFAHEVDEVLDYVVTGDKDAVITKKNCVLDKDGNVIFENVPKENWENRRNDSDSGEHSPPGETTYPSDSTWVESKVDVDPQQMDNAKLVPILTAALQESITKIETLETKVKALEDA